VKGLDPAARVTAEEQAATASFFSRLGVGVAATKAANAARLKEYFMLLAGCPCLRDWEVTIKRTIKRAKGEPFLCMNHTEKFWIYELKVILCLYGIRTSRPEIMDIYPIWSMTLCSVKSYYSLEVDE